MSLKDHLPKGLVDAYFEDDASKSPIPVAAPVLRQTAAMSWMFCSTAEMLDMSDGGIGMMLDNSNRHLHLSEVLALQLVVLGLGLVQDYLLGWMRKKVCPWVKS